MKKLVKIELYVDEVNDISVGEALGRSIIKNELTYEQVDAKKEHSKFVDIVKYCAPHADNMWAATIIGKILNCDFRDAKRKADEYLSTIAER